MLCCLISTPVVALHACELCHVRKNSLAGMISEEMDKSLFNSPGPPPTQPGDVPPTQPGCHPPTHTIRVCSSLEEPLVQGSAPDDLEMCSSDEDQLKKSNLEFCSILYGPENLNQERCSSVLPGNTLCLPSNCSLSPIRRDRLVCELDVPVDLEDSVFLSPGKSLRVFASSATSQTTAPETIVVTTGIIS